VNQYRFGDLVDSNYNSIFLREGGVYLLPLDWFLWEGDDWWNVIGDQDVLFEVDENGFIWSHSPFTEFNQFDGKEANVVAEAIAHLIANENFAMAKSSFGQTLRWDYDLTEVMVISVEPVTSIWRSDPLFRYTLHSTSGEFTAISWEDDYFEVGERYLVFLVPTEETEDGIEIWSFYSTKINDDGKIRGDSVFSELVGYTVNQVIELAERIITWYD
jgi:hypothetical protein